jgi:hypothetical protein
MTTEDEVPKVSKNLIFLDALSWNQPLIPPKEFFLPILILLFSCSVFLALIEKDMIPIRGENRDDILFFINRIFRPIFWLGVSYITISIIRVYRAVNKAVPLMENSSGNDIETFYEKFLTWTTATKKKAKEDKFAYFLSKIFFSHHLYHEIVFTITQNYVELMEVKNAHKEMRRDGNVVKIKWNATETDDSKLFLYRTTGEVCFSPHEVRNAKTSKLLDFATDSKPIDFYDYEIINHENYNYYCWVETNVLALVYLSFKKVTHYTEYRETNLEKIIRMEEDSHIKTREDELNEGLKVIIPTDQVIAALDMMVQGIKSKKERHKKVEDYIDELDLSGEEKTEIYMKIHSKLQEIDKKEEDELKRKGSKK